MQCINLKLLGNSWAQPQGLLGTELYMATDPGIPVEIYFPVACTILRPSLIAGVTPILRPVQFRGNLDWNCSSFWRNGRHIFRPDHACFPYLADRSANLPFFWSNCT
ncbi:hypothetical protein BJX61DRAFT_524855 [Aspergillus egyptiacus]|nr:hypothetical protein BJX61DRAFT_524855 [Aspergillus egyptiacus]